MQQGGSIHRAPDSLTASVLAELERRSRMPWWQKTIDSWPNWAKFSLGTPGLLLLLIVITGYLLYTPVLPSVPLLSEIAITVLWLQNLIQLLLRSLQPWLTVAIAAYIAAYSMLAALVVGIWYKHFPHEN